MWRRRELCRGATSWSSEQKAVCERKPETREVRAAQERACARKTTQRQKSGRRTPGSLYCDSRDMAGRGREPPRRHAATRHTATRATKKRLAPPCAPALPPLTSRSARVSHWHCSLRCSLDLDLNNSTRAGDTRTPQTTRTGRASSHRGRGRDSAQAVSCPEPSRAWRGLGWGALRARHYRLHDCPCGPSHNAPPPAPPARLTVSEGVPHAPRAQACGRGGRGRRHGLANHTTPEHPQHLSTRKG